MNLSLTSIKDRKTVDVRRACTEFLQQCSEFYKDPTCSIRVLAARPLKVRENWTTELFGDYDPGALNIRLWMRTAVRKEVTSYRTFLSTLCHEFCHHLDFHLFKFEDSWHTRGFYERTAVLYHHARGTPLKKLAWAPISGSAGGLTGRGRGGCVNSALASEVGNQRGEKSWQLWYSGQNTIPSMKTTLFFSWQTDTPSREGRNFIEKALRNAIKKIASDTNVEEAIREELGMDKDTQGVPGSPAIVETILKKIDNSTIFLPDLTFIGRRPDGRPTPNPNVLIEYGWALKSIGLARMLPVMNEAFGKPSRESMPFDMAHLRFPITYNLPAEASDAQREAERKKLESVLVEGLKDIFGSEEFKATLPKPLALVPFPEKQPLTGRARFRAAGEPLGINDNSLGVLLGQGANPIRLRDGAAIWLRVMPSSDSGRRWLFNDLRDMMLRGLAILPLTTGSQPGSIGVIRADDGCGCYPVTDPTLADSVCYAFNTGEVWAIDSRQAGEVGNLFKKANTPDYLAFDEKIFVDSLIQGSFFLQSLDIPLPHRWIAGIEGFKGRLLAYAPQYNPSWGAVSVFDVVEESGTYNEGDNVPELLRPFFERVFDAFGRRRPGS